MSVLALDLGWKWIGRVLAPVEELPLRGIRSDRLRMSPEDPWPVLDHIMSDVRASGHAHVIIEHAPFFAIADHTAAANARRAQMHEKSAIMNELIRKALRDDGYTELFLDQRWPDPLPPRTFISIPRNTWAHRVVPRYKGGISDELAIEFMRAHVDAEAWAQLGSQDEIDAAGCVLWWLLPAPPKVRKRRDPRKPPRALAPPEVRAARKKAFALERGRRFWGSGTAEERAAVGCTCTAKHTKNCPIYQGRRDERERRAEERICARIADAVKRGPYLR